MEKGRVGVRVKVKVNEARSRGLVLERGRVSYDTDTRSDVYQSLA